MGDVLILRVLCHRWKTGNVYVGDWQDGIAHGHGSFSYNTGPRKGEEYKEREQQYTTLTLKTQIRK